MKLIKVLLLLLKDRLRKYYNPAAQKKILQDAESRQQFYAMFVRKNDLVFDIGANMGNRVAPLLALGAKVLAVEPQETCYLYLKLKYGNSIHIEQKASGAGEYTSTIRLNRHSSTIASMSEKWIGAVQNSRFKNYTWSGEQKVTVTTLDELIRQYGRPGFIKIDVEGFEAEVLKGLSQPVDVISFEYTTPEMLGETLHCLRLLNALSENYQYNFSIAENNTLASPQWISYDAMKELLSRDAGILKGFGDIYACLHCH
jgi:FkbM family methyltransferase